MTIALVVLGAACVALAVVAAIHRRRMRPSEVAKRRLDAQLAALQRELAALQTGDRGFAAEQEELARQRWIQQQMSTTPIETLDLQGISTATFETLRAHGIACLADLVKLRQRGFKVKTIGAKKATQLIGAYRRWQAKLTDEARRMDRAALDEATGGELGAALARHDAAIRERQRHAEQLQIAIEDVERRRAQLGSDPSLH